MGLSLEMPSARAVILAACCMVATLSAASPATGESCASSGTCIRPVPRPAPPRSSLADNLQQIRCHLSCVSELINQETAWPSFVYSSLPCPLRQKVDQCTMGCMTKHRAPGLTVNRCRDQCVTGCESDRESAQEGDCDTTCRRTFCRFGCAMYQSLQAASHTASPAPMAAPVITSHPDSDSGRKLFAANISAALPSRHLAVGSELNNSVSPQNMSYLYKIQKGNDIHYLWQKDVRMLLDFSAFACEQIQVSFSVVSQRSHSEFSPALSLCLDGVGGWPSSVNHSSINISYAEDTRDTAYLGYSTANISWTRPQGHQFITSYTIFIFTRTVNCGGLNTIYSYTNIGKDATWFSVSAVELNGLLKFGCSYTLSVVPMPEQPNRNRPTINMAPELMEPDPEMRLDCRRVWDERGFMNISIDWVLSSPALLPAIRRFSVVPLLVDTNQPGLFGRLHEYPRHRITPELQVEKLNYSLLLTNLSPQRTQSYKYKIEVRVERSSQYLWRRVPSTESCLLSAQSEPPSTVTGATISRVEIERGGGVGGGSVLHFNLSWSPPLTANGALVEYEVNVVTAANGSGALLHQSMYPASQLSVEVDVTFLPNTSTPHCLYAMVRSRNEYVWSEWSEPEVITLDQQYQSDSNTSLANDSVTLFYRRAGEEAVRITQLSCNAGPNTTIISDKLWTLEQKLDSVGDVATVQSVGEDLVERLRTIESKIDQLIDAVSQSSSGG